MVPPVAAPAAPRGPGATRPGLAAGLLLGVATGTLATLAAALSSPELYIDWGALAGVLVVIPLYTIGAGALVSLPLAATRRISWKVAAAAVATSLVVGEAIFAATQGSSFARWSAARHWAQVERRAAGERAETQREICRRVLAEPPIPPPPAPPGATVLKGGIAPGTAGGATLLPLTRERCAELLGR